MSLVIALAGLTVVLTACSKKTSEVVYSFDCIDESMIRPNAPTTMEYNPVCGCNGVTYASPGMAKNNGVTEYSQGACPCTVKRADEKPCPRIMKPVCGCDGNTYDNQCMAINAGVTAWEKGPCEGK